MTYTIEQLEAILEAKGKGADMEVEVKSGDLTIPLSATTLAADLIAAMKQIAELEWQPIETAPNDIDIMIFRDDGSFELVRAEYNDFIWLVYDGWSPGITKPTHWRSILAPKGGPLLAKGVGDCYDPHTLFTIDYLEGK